MSQRFRCCDLNQVFLLPPALQDWLPEEHLARFVAQLVDTLDLQPILRRYTRRDGRGRAAHHPVMMVRLLLYGYAVGVRSSRAIEKATFDDVAFRYLAADQHPDHDCIAEFRKAHLKELGGLFLQALRLCQTAGLVKLGEVALDGTKIAASASGQRNRTYQRLSEKEQALAAEVERLLSEAARADEREDELFGKGKRGDELPPELATAAGRLARLRAAKQELEREAGEKAEAAAREKAAQDGKARDRSQRVRWRRAASAKPAATTKGNLTDPESRSMVDGASRAFVQGYNAEVAVAGVPQIIVAQTVVQDANDRQQLTPMIEQVEKNLGVAPVVTLADTGFWNSASVVEQQARGVDVIVPPDAPRPKDAPLPANAPQNAAAKQMRQRLGDPEQRRLYQKRCGMVEPVFGTIKESLGYRRFLMRGLEKVRGEWGLICAAFNLCKLFRYAVPDRQWLCQAKGTI